MKQLVRRCCPFAVVLLASSLLALGQNSGYDLFQTGSGASVDLTSVGLGVVTLQGVPIQGVAGSPDTIMFRPQAVPSGGGTIPVILYALSMKSQSPVTFNGQQADVYITVNNTAGTVPTSVLPQPDALSPSTGTLTVYPSTSTFDSTITINADVIIVTTGSSPSNSAAVLASQPASPITLSQTGSPYTLTSSSSVTISPSAASLSNGGVIFKPKHQGPHPVLPVTFVRGCLIPPNGTGQVSPNSKSAQPDKPKDEVVVCVL